ncbi:hypothetical protein DJ71_00655, partial [Halorubrum sp. E3]
RDGAEEAQPLAGPPLGGRAHSPIPPNSPSGRNSNTITIARNGIAMLPALMNCGPRLCIMPMSIAIPFLAMVIVLLIRPEGLFGGIGE